MALMNKTQDWNEVAGRPDQPQRKLLPKGPQNIIIVSNENKSTNTVNPFTGQKGQMIVVTAMIEGGPLNGETFTENLNWDCAPKSQSQEDVDKAKQAEKIAEKTASNMAKALGIQMFNGDIDLFTNKRCSVDVDQIPDRRTTGTFQNTFRYRPLGNAAPVPAAGAVPPGFGQPSPAAAPVTAAPTNPFANPAR